MWRCICWVVLGICCSWASAQEDPKQLKAMYDDALAQLKAAQDRKNELAAQNETLQKHLQAAQAQIASLQKEVNSHAEKTYFLRSYQALWQEFLERNPELKVRWALFVGCIGTDFGPNGLNVLDRNWPLSLPLKASTE